MRHGSAIIENQEGALEVQDAPIVLPDAQTLGRRLAAFARIAAAMHADAARPEREPLAVDMSLSALLRVQS